jgi:hypothetical protein
LAHLPLHLIDLPELEPLDRLYSRTCSSKCHRISLWKRS